MALHFHAYPSCHPCGKLARSTSRAIVTMIGRCVRIAINQSVSRDNCDRYSEEMNAAGSYCNTKKIFTGNGCCRTTTGCYPIKWRGRFRSIRRVAAPSTGPELQRLHSIPPLELQSAGGVSFCHPHHFTDSLHWKMSVCQLILTYGHFYSVDRESIQTSNDNSWWPYRTSQYSQRLASPRSVHSG